MNRTLAIISTVSLVFIAGFCAVILLLIYSCGSAVDEGLKQADADVEKMKREMESAQKKHQKAMERSVEKLQQFKPFSELPAPSHPAPRRPTGPTF